MKQRNDTDTLWSSGAADKRQRRLQRLRLGLGCALLVGLGVLLHRGQVAAPWGAVALPLALWVLVWLLSRWSARRKQRRWRRDGLLFEPPLPKPISAIPIEREWRWPLHPLIRVPLALALIVTMYWVLVMHQMQLPGHWLILAIILALVNFWSWREPLLLVLIVTVGVALLSLFGWIIDGLPLLALLMMGLVVIGAMIVLVIGMRKRHSKDGNH